jgi:hypothetical protein
MNPVRRLLLLSGIASPLVYAAADAIAGIRWTASAWGFGRRPKADAASASLEP